MQGLESKFGNRPGRFSHRAVSEILRRRIVVGDWPSGHKLPDRIELGRSLGTSSQTLQRAIHSLVEDGFLLARRGEGTFVADALPHQHRVGLAFHAPQKSLFDRALAAAAKLIAEQGAVRFAEYAQFDRRYHEILRQDVVRQRLAGLILVYWHPASTDTPIITDASLPRVLITAANPDLPTVYPDLDDFIHRACRRLIERGRRRIAFLFPDGETNSSERCLRIAGELGLKLADCFFAPCAPHSPELFLRLMKQLPASSRPDGLIVADDHLLPSMSAGLLGSGWRVPADLSVVALTNFPYVEPTSIPVERLGFDAVETLNHCLKSFELQRAGQTPPKHVAVAARFDSELVPLSKSQTRSLEEKHA